MRTVFDLLVWVLTILLYIPVIIIAALALVLGVGMVAVGVLLIPVFFVIGLIKPSWLAWIWEKVKKREGERDAIERKTD